MDDTPIELTMRVEGMTCEGCAEAVRRTTQAQREVEERLRLATTTLARQVILLGAASFATTVVMHWEKRQRRAARQGHKAIATLKKQRRR